jgi:type IV pilus assembly protein PilY1
MKGESVKMKPFLSIALVIHYGVMLLGMFCIPFFPDISQGATAENYQASPPFATAGVPPLLMLVMGRNHKLY